MTSKSEKLKIEQQTAKAYMRYPISQAYQKYLYAGISDTPLPTL